MSERDVYENAKRKGKRAYRDGVPLNENPMISFSSRMAWRESWLAEQGKCEAREQIFQRGRCIAECEKCRGPIYENQPCGCEL
jgi:hypothetical protein